MTLDRTLLRNFIRDSIRTYTEDFKIEKKANPLAFSLNGKVYSVHVSYIHDSGNTRTNEDEVRIQISRSIIEQQKHHAENNVNIAFIGVFKDWTSFVAWDPKHIFSLKAKDMVSVYARQSQVQGVKKYNIATHKFQSKNLREASFAMALNATFLGIYLENAKKFHALKNEQDIHKIVEFNIFETGTSGVFEIGNIENRQRFEYNRKVYPRDHRFKRDVLNAYSHACCICNRQLGIVQAAHIIPHSERNCPNTVKNGLAMCVEHHKLYDDALLLPGPNRELFFNEERANYLITIGQERGLDELRDLSTGTYTIPGVERLAPLDEYLERGLAIRMGA